MNYKKETIDRLIDENVRLRGNYEELCDKYSRLKNENETLKDEIKTLHKNLDVAYTQIDDIVNHPDEYENQHLPIFIENLNVTYYANGPVWTNEEDEDDD